MDWLFLFSMVGFGMSCTMLGVYAGLTFIKKCPVDCPANKPEEEVEPEYKSINERV